MGPTGEPITPVPPVPEAPRGEAAIPFECDPAQTPVELPLRRLSRAEYLNTVRAFANAALPQSNGAAWSALGTELGQVPQDTVVKVNGETHGGFSRLDQTTQQATVDATYAVSVALARQATRPTARLTELMGSCATDSNTVNDAACLSALVDKLGPLAVRHTLSADDRAFFIATAGTTPVDPDAVADVLTVMTAAPGFLYHLESGDQPLGGEVFALDAEELAARLSYHFWQAPPDAALRASAASGALLQDGEYRTQVARLVADQRAEVMVDDFFNQWFRLQELGSLTSRVGTPQYDAFAGANRPTDQLRGAMFEDVLSAVRWNVKHGATLAGLLTDSRQFTQSAELAALYEAPVWDGTTEPARLPTTRSGLLTRAAFLANDSANTRPVMKGLRIRTALLCDSIPAPPGNLMVTTPELAADATTRQQIENLTEQPGSSCLGCHRALNPLGYVSEGFDALGRVRTHQQLFDSDGNPTGAPQVNTVSTPRVEFEDDRAFPDIGSVTTRLAESRRVDSCFARQYFRYSFQRAESLTLDACALRTLDVAARGGSLTDALAATAFLPGFKSRRLSP
ncbi:MAG: DUF1592 domain-containing protein [Archangium sp.]|nr:DUF1592 domain-containing protein [Archangium sp.]MDP3571406.1 DUF1592 domain-containing protein [Archangium sp.]